MNNIVAIGIMLILIGLISKTERQYMILWAFATPVFYILFGFKSFYISLGFTDVELFSGVLPMVVCIMAWQKLTPTEKRRAWKYSPKFGGFFWPTISHRWRGRIMLEPEFVRFSNSHSHRSSILSPSMLFRMIFISSDIISG